MPHRDDAGDALATSRSAVSGEMRIGPNSQLDGMIAGQIAAANRAALELYSRAWAPEQSFEVRTKYLALADRAARTVGVLAEVLARTRAQGQQNITVRHVTVNADNAIVAENLVGGREGEGGGGGKG